MPMYPLLLFFVEDDEAVRTTLHLLLKAQGWGVRSFSASQACLDAALRQAPSCILAELSLPGMSAIQLKQRLASMKVMSPMVVLTDHVDPSLAIELRAAGIDEMLEKPCRDTELQAALTRAIVRQGADCQIRDDAQYA